MRKAGQESSGQVSEDLDEARRILGSALAPVCPAPERQAAENPSR
jgi:hypothetical protein